MAAPASPSADRLAAKSRPAFYRRPLLIVSIVGLMLLAGSWYELHQQINVVRREVASRLAAATIQSNENRVLAEQAKETTKDAQIKLGVLESKLQESQNQQVALEAMYQELSRSRDESVLADVEQTLTIASQQLQIAGNVKSALIALSAADTRLARLDRPQLAGLRKAIARDIDRLKVAPYVDVIGLSARLDSLAAAVDTLPLAMEVRPQAQAQAQVAPAGSVWDRLTRELWQDIRDLVRVQNMNRPDVPLLVPSQVYFLRENLKLRFLGARLALLARDGQSYKADLNASRDWLQRYFDVHDKSVSTAVDTVSQLAANDISVELPDIGASLEAVRNYRVARERPR
jgi:uroporphyrin-3 C-methyltransferase